MKKLKKLTNFKIKTILLIILLVAAVTRLYRLNTIPSILSEKETLIGYSAYSILKTGKDITGQIPFLEMESPKEKFFSLYSVLSTPSISALGLKELSVRLPSALAGVFLVLLVYLLAKEIFQKTLPKQATNIAILSAFFSSISPWNIFSSRLVSPENLSLFFFIIGLCFLIRNKTFIISLIFFTLSILSWKGALVLVPVLIITYFLLSPSSKWKQKLLISISLIEFACLLLTNQFEVVFKNTLFADAGQLNLPKKILVNFLDYFSAEFLFFQGDYRLKYWLGDLGVVYLFFLPFLITGIVFTFSRQKKLTTFLIFWALLSFAYAALGFNMRDAQRSLWASVPLQIILAVGAFNLFLFIKSSDKKIPKLFFCCLLLACFYNVILFYHFYFVHFSKKSASQPEYAFKNAGLFLAQNHQNYQRILVDTKYGDFYLYLLFYMKYPPKLFQTSGQKPSRFGKLTFDNIFKENLDSSQKTLLIIETENQNLPQEANLKKTGDFSTFGGSAILSAWEVQ